MLNIIVNNRKIDQYNHNKKVYVEGRKGSPYTIQFYNDSAYKRLVVLSVDGLNVLSGDKNWKKGYIVEAWGTINVPGWTKDKNNVACFIFSSVDGSYNQHNTEGSAENVGVIGAMIYDQKPIYSYNNYIPLVGSSDWGAWSSKSGIRRYGSTTLGGVQNKAGHSGIACSFTSTNSAVKPLSAPDSEASQELGTKWGKNEAFQISETYFNANDHWTKIETIYYDTKQGLQRRGIELKPKKPVNYTPNPFPSSGFCPPPK